MGSAGPTRRYGDEVASLFAAHAAGLVRLAEFLVGDRSLAEELVQEAFVRAWRSWRRLRNQQAALAYVRATVVNLARNSTRRRLLELRHRAGATVGWAAPERDVGARLDLERAVARLPIGKRACVVLRFYADLSEEETARVLGVSVGTVKSQTHKGLVLLARHLTDEQGAPSASRGGGR